MDQGNIIYIWSSLEDHGHNSKFLTILLDDKFLQDIRYTYDDNFHLLISICRSCLKRNRCGNNKILLLQKKIKIIKC
jgi:hypothetical protein